MSLRIRRQFRLRAGAAMVVPAAAVGALALAAPAVASSGHHPAASHGHHRAASSGQATSHGRTASRGHHENRGYRVPPVYHRAARHGRHQAFDPDITINVAGLRNIAGVPEGLYGVTYRATGENGDNAECTTNNVGTCTIEVSSTAIQTYTVEPVGVPGNWFANPGLGVYPSTAVPADNPTEPYDSFTTGELGPNDVTTLPVPNPDAIDTTARGGQVAFSRTDTPEPTECGLKVGMLFDLSTSITGAILPGYLQAGEDFVTALQGTPSQVGVYTFGTTAPASTAANNASLPPRFVTTATQAQEVKDHIRGLTVPPMSFTNWDAGLRLVANANEHYDVVVVLTDGDPTRWGYPVTAPNPPGAGVRTRFIDVENGIFSANALKNTSGTVVAHPAVLAVGIDVPSPGSRANLRSISGDDDYFTTDFAHLGATLRSLARQQCEGTITVVKHVVPHGDSVSQARPGGAGWRFTSSTPSREETTGDSSAVNFETAGETPTRITEHGRPGSRWPYTFLPRETRCRYTDSEDEVPYQWHSDGLTVTPDPDQAITCDVYNEEPAPHPELTVAKHASPGTFTHAGQRITYHYRVTNTGNVTMHDIGVDDDRLPGTITSCGSRTLDPGHYTFCTAEYTITPEDVERGYVHNFARARGKDPDGTEVTSPRAEAKVVDSLVVPVTG